MPEEKKGPPGIVVMVTVSNFHEGRRMANKLLDEHVAACVNIIPGVTSVYEWKGKRSSSPEAMLIIKTTAALLDDLIRTVEQEHSYDLPEIIALPMLGGNPEYLKWLEEQTGGGEGR